MFYILNIEKGQLANNCMFEPGGVWLEPDGAGAIGL